MAKFRFWGLIGFMVITGSIGFVYRDHLQIEHFRDFIEQAGWLAPFVFICIYSLLTVLMMPGAFLTILGGLLFGALWGSVINLAGALLGATGAFLVSRFLTQDWFRESAGNRLKTIMKGIEKEGWRYVALMRLIPIIPFNLLNYVLGMTTISLTHYFIASSIFMIPGTVAYTLLGSLGQDALVMGRVTVTKLLWVIALLAGLSALPWIYQKWRKNRRNNHEL